MSLCFKKKEKNVFGQMIEAPCIIIFCQHKRLKNFPQKFHNFGKKRVSRPQLPQQKAISAVVPIL